MSDATKNVSANVYISGITVQFATPPPAVLAPGTTANPVATVANDSALAGVNWSCTPTGVCGSFNPQSTTNGVSTTYTAPSKGTNVVITATSVTDPKASVSAALTVSGTASLGMLKGQYAFLIRANVGNQTTRGVTTFLGSVSLDGMGNVTGGIEDLVSPLYYDQGDPICPTQTAGPCSAPAPPPNASFYTVDANGHGTLRMMTQHGETLDISFIATSPSHAEVIETAGDPGYGTLDLQTTKTGQPGGFDVSQISGNYAFTLDGVNGLPSPTHKLSVGGVFQADGKGNITNATLDVNDNGAFTTTVGGGGTISIAPDTNGRGQLIFSGKSFGFYVINNKVLRLFEDDGFDYLGGSAYAQSAAIPPPSGTFVYQHSGWNSSGTVRTVAAGQFTADTTGAIKGGISDSNASGVPTIPSVGKPVSGSYQPDLAPATLTLTDATGGPATLNVYPVDPTLNILDPNNASGGGGALLLHTDANLVGSGILLPQNLSAPSNLLGLNALNLENAIVAPSPREVVLAGVFTSDGVSSFTNGLADYDWDDATTPTSTVILQTPFTGSYAADSANNGHFTGTFNIPTPAANPPALTTTYPFILPSTNIFSVSIYQASGSQAFIVQTDATANVSGFLIQQQLP
ncbi:MAG TPA: hypothetical protein VMR90_02175 [Candidatus Cybelea sp.]|nr:hypothetical protein [Candidatus Cybelea sp.]